jgi:16S rRNA (adenine(1408)-N(1))-methyltransferase
VAVDLGTGDGRHVLAAAARQPDTLFVGVDANAAAMADSSRRAWRGRTALPNALFAVAAAEQPPEALHGLAGSLTVTFPWGSLLRGVLGEDDAVLAGVARLMAPGAEGVVLLSVVPRDGMPPVPRRASLGLAYERHGLELVEMRPATPEEVAASGSSWAKRLRAGRDRPVTLMRLRAYPTQKAEPGCHTRGPRLVSGVWTPTPNLHPSPTSPERPAD